MTATTPSRRPGGRSARVRAAVLAATTQALLEHGLDELSVADVAHRAGVHEVSIYRRWGTRANLALDAVLAEIRTVVPEPDTGSLRGDVRALLYEIRGLITSPLGQILLQLAVRPDLGEYRPARDAFWAARLAVAGRVLERAESRGELQAGLDRHVAVETLVAPLSLRMLLTREPLDDAFLEAVADLVTGGIRRRR
jgi:AcrR family transcriptional regulator